MTDPWSSERAQAADDVSRCERELRQAQDIVRSAGETLRRAIRREKTADGELCLAEQRRDRFGRMRQRAG
jgi:hypothetical protein